MASGKLSPRQKMINMMYLVLTALLAMNVSKEVINAFKTINASLGETNRVMDDKNSATLSALKDALDDDQQKKKAQVWKPLADEIAKESDDLVAYLEKYKQEIKKQSGLEIVEGEEQYKFENIDVSTRVMVEEKKGHEIYKKVSGYQENVLGILAKALNDPTLNEKTRERLKLDLDKFKTSLPVKLIAPKKDRSGDPLPNDANGWTKGNFYMTPSVAAVTLMTKLQTDVKSSEGQLTDYCLNQLGKVKLVYDKFSAVAAANTTYCMPGEEIEVSAGVGAFNDQAKPRISIKGASVPLNSEGIAVKKFTASSPGSYQIPVTIAFTTPDGEDKSVNKLIKYTVGQPSGAALMLDKMNVFYIGLDNPITVSSGTGDEKTSLSASGGGVTLKKSGPGKYIVRATKVGNSTITVNSDGQRTPFQFRVKRVPDPICTIGGNITTGRVKKGTLSVQQGLIAKLVNFDFDAKFTVLSFEYVYIPRGNGDLVTGKANGPRFPSNLTNSIRQAKSDDVFSFENVRVKGPDGSTRKITGISVTISK